MKKFVFSKTYDFSLFGLEKLHPFDGRKFSRAWGLVQSAIPNLDELHLEPLEPVSDEDLLIVHTHSYLKSLQLSSEAAKVIEIGPFKYVPNSILQKKLITPVKYACKGTILATELALKNKNCVMNVGGGFHHAFADHGEGFCFFADAALSIMQARQSGWLKEDDAVLMIDLDAHRGNGFESFFTDDKNVHILDFYNFQVYPGLHPGEINDFPFMVPLRMGMVGEEYLKALEEELPKFLDTVAQPKLAFYNAGTDILAGDPLGGLNVSFEDVVKRDRMILEALEKRGIPTVVLTSGGYSKESYKLVAELGKLVHGLGR